MSDRPGAWAEADLRGRKRPGECRGEERTRQIPREGGRRGGSEGNRQKRRKGDMWPLRQTHTVTPSPLATHPDTLTGTYAHTGMWPPPTHRHRSLHMSQGPPHRERHITPTFLTHSCTLRGNCGVPPGGHLPVCPDAKLQTGSPRGSSVPGLVGPRVITVPLPPNSTALAFCHLESFGC